MPDGPGLGGRRTSVRWLPQELRSLRHWVAKGLTFREVLDRFPGRTAPAVSHKMLQLGIRTRRRLKAPIVRKPRESDWTKAQDDRLRLLVNQGVVFKLVAEELGKSVAAVHHRRERLDLLPRCRGGRVELKVRLEPELRAAAARRAARRGLSLSVYVRSLIARDV